ncbi:cholecystokinin receptor type A-like [Ruditapes philippinarum]|uniref:cholecystokinin receptor type A-like n=1 Tax=Ruditapes philippinarum TaxID=129788 RepID=UPI00295BA594|nr:cholecystokinin receptor type A-like [Ruditapes philippinarum]
MNSTTVNEDVLLQELNDKTAVLMVPALVYMVILMLAGLIGNVLVLFFYGWKSRPSTNNTFILCVSMYDLMFCTLSIPIEIVDIRFFYNFPYAGACKVMRFINYFAAIGSAFTLIVISIDRYRKICRPFKNQFQQFHVRLACGMSIPFSLFLSWPAAVFYTSVPVEVSTDDGIKVTGFDCTTTKEPSYKIYLFIFNGFFLFIFIVSTVIIFTMYALVGKTIYKHQKAQVKHTRCKSSTGSHVLSHNNMSDTGRGSSSNGTEKDNPSSTGSNNHDQIVQNKAKDHVNVKTIKFTTVMFVITIVFIISFLPHLALSLWRAFRSTYEGETLDGAGLVAFQIGLRSYFLNSAINPLTYGFFNPRFRAFFYKRFCPCCKRVAELHITSSSSGKQNAILQLHPQSSHSVE